MERRRRGQCLVVLLTACGSEPQTSDVQSGFGAGASGAGNIGGAGASVSAADPAMPNVGGAAIGMGASDVPGASTNAGGGAALTSGATPAGVGGSAPSASGGAVAGSPGIDDAAAGGATGGTGGVALGESAVEQVPYPGDPALGLCAVQMVCSDAIDEDEKISCEFEVRDSAASVFYASHAGVEYRGRSSLNFPKKNYSLELRTSAGDENPANLLGMGKESDWILDGGWADRSLMRNSLVYDLFRDIGHYASQGRFCTLSLNGEARGIYRLGEKPKRDDDRIDIPEDDGSGASFVIKQDDEGALQLNVGQNRTWELVSPNQRRATEAQRGGVQAWLDELEVNLDDAAQQDPNTALFTLLEPGVLVDWILIQELSKNIDGYNLSLHLSRAPGQPARMIPWDFDLAFGQPIVSNRGGQGSSESIPNEDPQGWIWNRTEFIELLDAVDALRARLAPRWTELRAGPWSGAAITARIDAYQADLEPAAVAANFEVWPIEDVDFSFIYPPYTFSDVESYEAEVAAFRTWIQERLAWMDANIDSFPMDP